MELSYSILDPTGNITALVESPVGIARQPSVAAEIMRRRPAVEQVGFLRPSEEETVAAELRMAGGEFCGNASLCAAALTLMREGRREGELRLRVSGTAEPVAVRLRQEAGCFAAEIRMPSILGIVRRDFGFEGLCGPLPLVRMEGISHLVVEPGSPFFGLLSDREAAERAARALCDQLEAEGLGLMFLEGEGAERRLTPLVCIPDSGTVFWENSCASGSAAAGLYLAGESGAPVELTLREPGGTLSVTADPMSRETRLSGRARLVARYSENFSESC